MPSIVDVVVADKNLATMSKGVKAAELENELSKPGPFTVLAPNEIAFGKLPQGELTELMQPENKARLKTVLNYHVVEGKTEFKDFKDGQKLKTISGRELDVRVTNGDVFINGSAVMGRDGHAANGVVHSLDRVMFSK